MLVKNDVIISVTVIKLIMNIIKLNSALLTIILVLYFSFKNVRNLCHFLLYNNGILYKILKMNNVWNRKSLLALYNFENIKKVFDR